MQREKKSLILYVTTMALFALIVAWWLIYFTRQGDLLVARISDSGAQLTPEQMDAVRGASARSLRMFVFEGGFLMLLVFGGFLLILRSLRREVEFHRRQRDFLSAITHELRSPIASARLQTESLLLGRVPEAKRTPYFERTLDDLDRLSRTVDQLLTAARTSSGQVQLLMESVDLAAFTRKVVERLPSSKEVIEVLAPGVVRVRADAEALATIVENLLSNAIKYGGQPPRVSVTVDVSGDCGFLVVSDYGPGLDGKESARMFDAFVRGRDEIVKQRPGVGLGLYLVAELTHALGGKVMASTAAEGGLAVRVELPLEPALEEGSS